MRAGGSWWRRLALGGLMALALAAPSARAQEEEDTGPFFEPGITYRKSERPYIQWVAGTVIIAGCLFVAFKNPHRSHLD